MRYLIVFIACAVMSLAADTSLLKRSVVKIFTVSSNPDFRQPWTSSIGSSIGTGCIIKGKRILTNAHVVTNATFIEVLKNGDTKKYEAKVISICHDCDLALLEVKEKHFFDGTKPLEIDGLPKLEEKVAVYGYPEGGETLSITQGVISRIEHQIYVHSMQRHLAIQIDAAVNPGNSGGPVIAHGKLIGIVMQMRKSAQNIGYIIPSTEIRHYLKDIQDGHVDGYPTLGIIAQKMENPSIQELYHVPQSGVGLLVDFVIPSSPSDGMLKPNDVILKMDNYKVYSNGKVEFRKGEFTSFLYALDRHQVGDTCKVTIMRDEKIKTIQIKLNKTREALKLVKRYRYHPFATYFIYGGYVFVPASQEYRIPSKYYEQYPSKKRKELVFLYRVLPSEMTRGFERVNSIIIDKVNGEHFKDFKEFVKLVDAQKGRFVIFEDEYNYQIVLDKEQVKKLQSQILARYNIKSDRSDDLKTDLTHHIIN